MKLRLRGAGAVPSSVCAVPGVGLGSAGGIAVAVKSALPYFRYWTWTMSAVMQATMKPSPTRSPTISGAILCGANATQVLKITTRLMIGPASMYAMQHESGSPLRRSRRITTTMPHSHIGKMSPKTAPIITDGRTCLGRNLVIACWGKNSSRMPATSAPKTMKGIASQRTELNRVRKSEISFTGSPSWVAG